MKQMLAEARKRAAQAEAELREQQRRDAKYADLRAGLTLLPWVIGTAMLILAIWIRTGQW